AIVGNPPYVLLQDEFRDEVGHPYLKARYEVASFKVDTYHLFFERAGKLLRETGRLGYITPSNYLTNNHLEDLRRFLLSNLCMDRIVVYEGKVFHGASVDTATTICTRDEHGADELIMLRVLPVSDDPDEANAVKMSREECLSRPHALITPINAHGTADLFSRVESSTGILGDFVEVSFGKQLRDRKKFQNDVIEVENLSEIPGTHTP